MDREVRPGDTFQFFESDGGLCLTMLVLEVEAFDGRFHSRVLILDLAWDPRYFRADVGQTTGWIFSPRDPEWRRLRRVL